MTTGAPSRKNQEPELDFTKRLLLIYIEVIGYNWQESPKYTNLSFNRTLYILITYLTTEEKLFSYTDKQSKEFFGIFEH